MSLVGRAEPLSKPLKIKLSCLSVFRCTGERHLSMVLTVTHDATVKSQDWRSYRHLGVERLILLECQRSPKTLVTAVHLLGHSAPDHYARRAWRDTGIAEKER